MQRHTMTEIVKHAYRSEMFYSVIITNSSLLQKYGMTEETVVFFFINQDELLIVCLTRDREIK